jgi:hypothetical protein
MRGKVKLLVSSFTTAARSGINKAQEMDMVLFLIECGAGVTIDRTFKLVFSFSI